MEPPCDLNNREHMVSWIIYFRIHKMLYTTISPGYTSYCQATTIIRMYMIRLSLSISKTYSAPCLGKLETPILVMNWCHMIMDVPLCSMKEFLSAAMCHGSLATVMVSLSLLLSSNSHVVPNICKNRFFRDHTVRLKPEGTVTWSIYLLLFKHHC